jgi:hypothetical protein
VVCLPVTMATLPWSLVPWDIVCCMYCLCLLEVI